MTLTSGSLPPSPRESSRFRHADTGSPEFLQLWSEGIPFVITDVKRRCKWDPQHFIDRYGKIDVTLEDCETGELLESTVAKYFQTFLSPDKRDRTWKLKVIVAISVWILRYD